MIQASEPLLAPRHAYLAMFEFLRQYYLRGKSDEIGGMLGGMSLLEDGKPADSAYEADWSRAVQVVLKAEASSIGYREADFRLVD